MWVFWFAGGRFAIPSLHDYSASLLEGSAVSNVLVIAVIYLGVVGVASVLVGSLKPGLGVFAASFGLAAISGRGGTVGDLLRSHGSGSYLLLLIETLLLAAIVAGGAAIQGFLVTKPPIKEVEEEDREPDLSAKLISVATQTGVTVIMIWLLGAAPAKGQAMAAVGIASLVGALVADNAMPVGLTPLAILAPFLAAVIGYAWAALNYSGTTPANPLATALPLDYASFGVAGAMLAHWISQQWRDEAAAEEAENAE
jgi:hypothetical protein